MNDWNAQISQFAKLIEPWLPAYRYVVRKYFAVRLNDGWRLCAARYTFTSDIDPDPPPPLAIDTDHLSAGIDVTPIDAEALRHYLSEIASAPFRLMTGQRAYDLSRGGNLNRGRVECAPVQHHLVPGTRAAPGLQITFSEDSTPWLPNEQLLDAEVKAAKHHFASVRRLLTHLELNENILRLPVQPTIDVVALAPGRVGADTSRSKRISIAAAVSSSLAREFIDLKGTVVEHGNHDELPLKRPLAWRRQSKGLALQFPVPRRYSEVSLALTYQGGVLDSFATSANSSNAELSFPQSLAAALGEDTNTHIGRAAPAEPNRTRTDRWMTKVKNNPLVAALLVFTMLAGAVSSVGALVARFPPCQCEMRHLSRAI